jgi:hypothetical protein
MKCEASQPMTGSGEQVYTADSFTGTTKIDRGGQTITMKYRRKRLGDCTK